MTFSQSDGGHPRPHPHLVVKSDLTKVPEFPIRIEGLCLQNTPDLEFRQYFYATFEIDHKEQARTSLADNEWHLIKRRKEITLQVCHSSIFCLSLYLHRKFHGPILVGLIEEPVYSLLSHPQVISREVPWPAHITGAEGNMMTINFIVKHGSATAAQQLIDDIQALDSAPGDRSYGFEMTDRLKMITRDMSDSYPGAKMTLGILSTAFNVFLVEEGCHREHLRSLLNIVCETHSLASEASSLAPDMYGEPLARLLRHTAECAYFIREFVAKQGILHNLVNRVTSVDVDTELKGYIRKFEQLRSCFPKSGVQRCDAHNGMQSCLAKDVNFESASSIHRANSTCSASTEHSSEHHSEILEIVDDILLWVNDRGQEPVCLLSDGEDLSMADVAWHVACMFRSTSRPCSLYSFRHGSNFHDQPPLRHPQDVFEDIAKDIASKHPPFGQVFSMTDYRNVGTQFEELILAPAKRMSDDGLILVIIDALNECAHGETRKSILEVLAKKAAELPENFRILVTCQYEKDIFDALQGKMHVLERPFDSRS